MRHNYHILLCAFIHLAGLWATFATTITHADLTGLVAPAGLVPVGFASRSAEPADAEVGTMVDEAITQVLGPRGMAEIIQSGNKVVIKVNIVGPKKGAPGDHGRGVITDPRIVRHVAEKVRAIIGTTGTSSLQIVEACFYGDKNPSLSSADISFYWARLERGGNNAVDAEDICYDYNRNGILDGTSNAQLVNLDAIPASDKFTTQFSEPSIGATNVSLPKFLRTRAQAQAAGEPNQYCDVLISLPILKSHHFGGLSAAMKLHYGFRDFSRFGHSGTREGSGFGTVIDNHLLGEYLVALHRARPNDLIIMDCLTGNRSGPDVANRNDPNYPVDYILMNAIMAARDSVAIDTVGALFGGYEPASIPFLKQGRLDGVGTDQTHDIFIGGFALFAQHRNTLRSRYQPQNRYPFREGWGSARIIKDFNAPTSLALSLAAAPKGRLYTYRWSAKEVNTNDLGISRVDLLVDHQVAASQKEPGADGGTIAANLSSWAAGKHNVRLAVWDKALNCGLSASQSVTLQNLDANNWKTYK